VHSHAGTRYTTQIDFQLAAKQAQAIKKALPKLLPNLENELEANYQALEKDLMALDKRVREIVARNGNRPLLASHPVYDYFARCYSLNLKSVLWATKVIPNLDQWKGLEKILARHPAKWMIWEGGPIKESVERLRSMGINSLVFDPCGNTPKGGDFISMMQQNVDNLRMAFQ